MITIEKNILIIILLPLLFLGEAQTKTPGNTINFEKIRQAIKQKLTDPDSAKFKNMRLFNAGQKSELVCGEINSKNRFGGYTGFQPFAYAIDQSEGFFEVGGDLGSVLLIKTMCVGDSEVESIKNRGNKP